MKTIVNPMPRIWMEHALADNGLVELRHKAPFRTDDGRTVTVWKSSLHDNLDSLRDGIRRAGAVDCYTSLNRPAPRKYSSGRWCKALRNADFEKITRLVIDLDPVRPTGTNSTAAELERAVEVAGKVALFFAGYGWPPPVSACSGNGRHLVYRINLNCNPQVIAAQKRLYALLADTFGTDKVIFDRKVCNPGRIWRLYGTKNRKGEHSDERPQRLSECWVPKRWEAVTPNQWADVAEALGCDKAATAPKQIAKRTAGGGRGDYGTLKVAEWFEAHQAYKFHVERNVHAVRCPWESEHSRADDPNAAESIIYETDGNGWGGFYCHHDHCDGRDIRDVMDLWGDADEFCTRMWAPSRRTA